MPLLPAGITLAGMLTRSVSQDEAQARCSRSLQPVTPPTLAQITAANGDLTDVRIVVRCQIR